MTPPSARVEAGEPSVAGAVRRELAGLFDAVPDAVVITDPGGTCVYANPACTALGCLPDALPDSDVLAIFPPRVHAVFRDLLAAAAAGQPRRVITEIVRPGGEHRQIEVTSTPIVVRDRPMVAFGLRDETEMQRLARKAEALAQIVSSIAFADSPEATLNTLARIVVHATGTWGCVMIIKHESLSEGHMAGTYGVPQEHLDAWAAAIQGGARPPGVEAWNERRVVVMEGVCERVLADPACAPVHHLMRDAPTDATVAVPMRYRGDTVGVLNVFYHRGRRPSDAEIDFLTTIAGQAAIVAENARLFLDARGKAALEERQRLARELHDSVSQALYGIALGAHTARTLLDRDPVQAVEPLDYVLSLAEAALTEMRTLIFELRPDILNTEGLVAALTKQIDSARVRHRLEVRAELADEPALPYEAKEALYRIAQEAIHNVVKHARARRLDVRLDSTAADTVLEVHDDGLGFAADAATPGHLGLRSMRERAAQVGGALEVESTAGGTRVRARVPHTAA